MSTTLENGKPVPGNVKLSQKKELDAEMVTAIATSFLKRIGNKGRLKPKKVSLKEGVFTIEVEMKKFTAVVRVDQQTQEVKEYEIQPKEEEASFQISPKNIIAMIGIALGIYLALNYLPSLIGI
jgi:hypothetical protein